MNQEKISNLIKAIRQDNNLTQQEFASLFNVTYQAVSKWERGINMPDINTLKNICNKYNLDINEFLNGNKKKNKVSIYIILASVLLLSLGLYIIFKDKTKPNYEFKPLTTTCENFNIKGSIAYNEKSSSIYISDIVYCGSVDNTEYKSINSSLHESNGKLIENGTEKESITIEEYLKNTSFYIERYTNECTNKTEYYLEIHAIKDNIQEVTYKVPLTCE